MAAIDVFCILTLEILILGILQVRVNNAQNNVNKSMYDFVSFNADRIDELVKENINLQKKVDLLETAVYNNNVE